MKAILVTCMKITHEEYQEFVPMIPDPEEAMSIQKLEGSAVMTNTCKSAIKLTACLPI